MANISNISINYPLPKQSANIWNSQKGGCMWSLEYRLVQRIGLKLDWWFNCAKTHLVGSHLVKADVGVPCSWVNAVLAKVLTHIFWCRLWQQSIDTFPETQGSRDHDYYTPWYQTQIPFILALVLLVMLPQDETLEGSCRLLAHKTLLLPHKHAAYCIQVEKCFTTVTYPAVRSKITVQEENKQHSKWQPVGIWAVYCSVWRSNHCQPHHKCSAAVYHSGSFCYGITPYYSYYFYSMQCFWYSASLDVFVYILCAFYIQA